MITIKQLIQEAKGVRKQAHVPYSNFAVGAAVLTTTGKIYVGCNIENAAYPVTCCAERVALFSAIAAGERSFERMAIVADTKRPIPPCGACRQVMSEFFPSSMNIHLCNAHDEISTWTMIELLPFSFQNSDLIE